MVNLENKNGYPLHFACRIPWARGYNSRGLQRARHMQLLCTILFYHVNIFLFLISFQCYSNNRLVLLEYRPYLVIGVKLRFHILFPWSTMWHSCAGKEGDVSRLGGILRQESSLSRKKKLDIQIFFLIDDANCFLFRLLAMQQQGTSELGFVPTLHSIQEKGINLQDSGRG